MAALLAALSPRGADYGVLCPRDFCNDPAHAIYDLATGDPRGFFEHQPTMGPVSLVLRAPFAAIGREMEGDQLTMMYRLGVFGCLLATGLIGLGVLGAGAFRRGRNGLVLAALLLAIWLLGPGTVRAIWLGHPEEMVAAALAIAGVVAAMRGRVVPGGVMVGLAVATKQWGLLAAAPLVLAAPPGGRARALITAGLVALAATLPMALGDFEAFRKATSDAVADVASTTQTNLWWPFTIHHRDNPPGLIRDLSHPLVLMVGVALAAAAWVRRRDGSRDDALALLALILLLRCVLDLYTFSYHHAPFIMALAAWEVVARRRVPLLALGSSALLAATTWWAIPHWDQWVTWAFYCAWTLLLAGWLTFRALERAPAHHPPSSPTPC